MGRRALSLLLFVVGYLLLATLEPVVAAGPALTSFVAATLVLARGSEPARILERARPPRAAGRHAQPGGGSVGRAATALLLEACIGPG